MSADVFAQGGHAPLRPDLESAILALEPSDDRGFALLLGEIHAYQRRFNPVVQVFSETGRYLPVAAFRETRVACFDGSDEAACFLSSGTGSGRRAAHPVRTPEFYDRVTEAGFDRVFGAGAFVVAGLLPDYVPESSLVRMVRHLARRTQHESSGIYADDRAGLTRAAERADREGRRFVLFGAAFALVDLADRGDSVLPGSAVVVETGGMKTHRREMSRAELHERLSSGFRISRSNVWSEYGMCELFSQAWARGGEWFESPPWMRYSIVDPADPEREVPVGTPGLLAIDDLANLYSASSLLTEDLAVSDGERFSVLGRAAGSPLRGCNFLMEP